MSTKVLNKLVNICTKLDGGEVSSGTSTDTSNGTTLSESELFDIIYPVGSLYLSSKKVEDTTKLFSYGTWRYLFEASIVTEDVITDTSIAEVAKHLYERTA